MMSFQVRLLEGRGETAAYRAYSKEAENVVHILKRVAKRHLQHHYASHGLRVRRSRSHTTRKQRTTAMLDSVSRRVSNVLLYT